MIKEVKKLIRLSICLVISLGLRIACAQPYPTSVSTIASSPVNPYIEDALGSPVNGITALIRGGSTGVTGHLIGKINRISSPVFTITIGYFYSAPQLFIPPTTSVISGVTLKASFGNFNNTSVTGAYNNINSLRDSSNGKIKLPPGQYRVCFYALNGNFQSVSDSNLGCASFNVCKAVPPQLTYPVSNLTIGSGLTLVQPNSPVNFAWMPPLASCALPGPINYELEIREILNNQTVTDALNNPFIFRKTAIPSTSFLLDLNLYQNVLQRGKKYAIRVRAASINAISPVVIENNGYSRIEAFQFGTENDVTPNVWTTQSYYIPLNKRKSNFWDDYESKRGRDTLVPIAEYIAYKLMQQGIAYNLDAIELILSLNPELKDMNAVRLYQPLKLPIFPEVPSSLLRNFELTHANSLKPDNEEVALFKRKLDSLKKINKTPEMFVKELTDLRNHLDKFSLQASLLNSVSLSFINSMLSELMFNLRKSQDGMTNSEYNHLRNISSDLKAISVIPSSTSSLNTDSYSESLSYNFSAAPIPGIYRLLASFPYHSKTVIKEKYFKTFYAVTDQLIPLNVIVYRPVQPPAKPIFNAPDLKGVYRIFYTPRNLYNNRNPEINAKSPGLLASTTQVSLPRKLEYKFWTLNMLNHKQTLAQDVDIDELFQKKDIKGKRLTIVLKVE